MSKVLNFRLGTFNCRTLRTDADLAQLEESMEDIPFDVIGLQETKRRGTGTLTLQKSGHLLFYAGKTAFLVHNRWNREALFFEISDRVSLLELKTDAAVIRAILTYAPTSVSSEQDYDECLNSIHEALRRKTVNRARQPQNRRRVITVILGDFNAKIGCGEIGEQYVGPYGIGNRNERGQTLADFCAENRLYVMNTRFAKRKTRKWTWLSPNMQTRNMIDYILSTDPSIFSDVDIIGRLEYPSDHRMVMAKMKIKVKKYYRVEKKVETKMNRQLFAFALEEMNKVTNLADYDNLRKASSLASEIAAVPVPVKSYLSQKTKNLFLKRHTLLHSDTTALNRVHFSVVSKTLRTSLKDDLTRKHLSRLNDAVKKGKSIKNAQKKNQVTIPRLSQLQDVNGNMTKTSDDVRKVVADFYNRLYDSNVARVLPVMPRDEPVPKILQSEVEKAVHKLKLEKSPGPDGITSEMIIAAKSVLLPSLTTLFNNMLDDEMIPDKMADATMTLLFKKGSPCDVKNYRPVSLLSMVYKLFTSILGERMLEILDSNQPAEQAGFRKTFSTLDHIQAVGDLIERAGEYKIPLFLVFIDFEKAFDSVEHDAVWSAMYNQGVPAKLIRTIHHAYTNSEVNVKAAGGNIRIDVKKGVRQGDTISPALFSAVIEAVMRTMNWDQKGININGSRLTNLRYADDIVLMAQSGREMQEMLNDLREAGKEVGLKINIRKTVALANRRQVPLDIDGTRLQYKEEMIYLGQRISFDRNNTLEISRRTRAGWAAFNQFYRLLTHRRIENSIKRKIYTSCIEPALLYATETLALRQRDIQKLVVSQRKMMRKMLGITLLHRRTVAWMEEILKLPDIRQQWTTRKWNWAQKAASMDGDRWTKRIIEWRPWTYKRPTGRPPRRWSDEFVEAHGQNWLRIAKESPQIWKDSTTRHATALIS